MSSRLDGVEESATLRIADLTAELKKQGKDILSFSVGEPDFDTPDHIIAAAKKAMDEGKTHYAPAAGIPELREAVASKLKKENKVDVTSKQVLITPGAKHAVFELCFGLLEDGDEAILLEPAWVSYDACIKMSGGKTVWVKTNEDGSIPGDLSKHVTKKTKLIIINSPNNPSGAVLSQNDIKLLADLAKDKGFYVLSDEIYEKIIYDVKHISIGSIIPEKTITINGFSKAYAMAGWRIGYAAAPPEIYKNMFKVQQHTITSPTTFVQYGALAALIGPQDCVANMVKEFRARREVIVKGFRDMGMPCPEPEGAFYAYPKVEGSSEKWAEKFLEAGVGLTPGSAFGPDSDDHLRMSYASSMKDIKEGMRRMKKVLEGTARTKKSKK